MSGQSSSDFTAAEQQVLHSARANRNRCICGEIHENGDSVTLATIARMKAYLAAHPNHQFVVDEETGIIAVIITPARSASGPLRVLAQSGDLLQLLNEIGAPSTKGLSLTTRQLRSAKAGPA